MTDNKLKKKIALIKASAHAFGLHNGLSEEDKKNLDEIITSCQRAREAWEEEKFEIGREICQNNLSQLIQITNTLTPTRLRKALLRQLSKIEKY
jgi:hypothetical protein